MKALKTKSHYAMESGISPVLALGTLHGAFGGAGTSWVGGHPGFNAAITDTAAGNYSVNLPINFALALITVHAQSMTAAIRCQVIVTAGPAVGGIATTNVQVLCYNNAGGLANADVMLVAFSTNQMTMKDSPVVAMGHIHEAALGAAFIGAAPGFVAAITNNGGVAGDYTIVCNAQSASAQLNLLVTCATADRHVTVIKTNVVGGGTTFRIIAWDNAGGDRPVCHGRRYDAAAGSQSHRGRRLTQRGGRRSRHLDRRVASRFRRAPDHAQRRGRLHGDDGCGQHGADHQRLRHPRHPDGRLLRGDEADGHDGPHRLHHDGPGGGRTEHRRTDGDHHLTYS
jgi:hypothetical protein